MSLLLETILYRHGKLQHLPWHQARFDQTRGELFGQHDSFDLSAYFETWRNAQPHSFGVDAAEGYYHRYRILYDAHGIHFAEMVKTKRRTVKTLQLIFDDSLEYAYKWADRQALERHFSSITGKADDFLLVHRGLLTDTYTANIVFWDGQRWVTPAKPLLKGTKRAQLLAQKLIEPADLRISDLAHFQEARLINASTDLEDSGGIQIGNILRKT